MARMRARRLASAALVSLALLPASPRPLDAADRSPQQQIESRLMCYCGCSDLTVRTCTCGVAAGIRDEIADRLARGETAEQVVAAFVGRHGEKILSAPTKEGFNLVAWVAPIVALAAAGVMIVLLVRRWGGPRGRGAATPRDGASGAVGGEPPPLTQEERARMGRIERDIREGL